MRSSPVLGEGLVLTVGEKDYFLPFSQSVGVLLSKEAQFPASFQPFGWVFLGGQWIPVLPPDFPNSWQKGGLPPWIVVVQGEHHPVGVFCSTLKIGEKKAPLLEELFLWLTLEEKKKLIWFWEQKNWGKFPNFDS